MDIFSFTREENLNVELARLLAQAGLKVYGEALLSKHVRPDALLKFNGVTVIIEGKKAGGWNELLKQCRERLESSECDICVMVEYVKVESDSMNLTQEDIASALKHGRFNAGVRTAADTLEKWGLIAPNMQEKYENVDFQTLAWTIYQGYTELASHDILGPVIDKIDEAVMQFAKELEGEADVEHLKSVLELTENKERPEDED